MLRKIFFLLMISNAAFSQAYQPFPIDSAMWRESGYQADASFTDSWVNQLFIKGDTVISGKTYHKILKTGTFTHNASTSYSYNYSNLYQGGIRENTLKQILICPAFDTAEVLLYDFNLSVGDTLPDSYTNGYDNWVSSVDSALLGGVYRKVFHISGDTTMSWAVDYVSIIEGVGSTFGLLGDLLPIFETANWLDCFKHRNTIVFPAGGVSCDSIIISIPEQKKEQKIVVFPSPTKGLINVKTVQTAPMQITIINILGEEQIRFSSLNGSAETNISFLPSGIYFVFVTLEHQQYSQKIIKE